jgi:peroxiredoxin
MDGVHLRIFVEDIVTSRSFGVESGSPGGIYALAIPVFLCISVILNIFLARETSHLRSLNLRMRADQTLQIGEQIPPLAASALDGTKSLITYSSVGMPTVLYVFTPECVWCKRNLGNLRALVDQSASGHYRVVGVSLSATSLAAYIKQQQLLLPIYVADVAANNAYHLGGTPETIAISTGGKVLHVWRGAYSGEVLADVEKALGIRLPGCCS